MSHQRRLYDDDAMCAGEQERQKVKKKKVKKDTTSPIREHAPAERTNIKFGMRGRVADVGLIMCFKF